MDGAVMGDGYRSWAARGGRPHASWQGLSGRNPVMVPPDRFGNLARQAAARIADVGVAEGRLSLAAGFLVGMQLLAELPDGPPPSWADGLGPVQVAFIGAVGGAPPDDVTGDELTAAADLWFDQLDASGANDRTRAFCDSWDLVAEHDNPYGNPLVEAFLVALADSKLALEALPVRLTPAQLGGTLDGTVAYLPGAARRSPRASGFTLHLSPQTVDVLRPAVQLSSETDTPSGTSTDDFADAIEAVDPAWAYAMVATDGLLLTEENQTLVADAARRRWLEAAQAYTTVTSRMAELPPSDEVDLEDGQQLDAAIDAGATLMEELVCTVDDGRMDAYNRLVRTVEQHPAGSMVLRQACIDAYSQLAEIATDRSFTGPVAGDVRQLASARFSAAEGVAGAVERALPVTSSLPDGDQAIIDAVGGPVRVELAVWVLLLGTLRAHHG